MANNSLIRSYCAAAFKQNVRQSEGDVVKPEFQLKNGSRTEFVFCSENVENICRIP